MAFASTPRHIAAPVDTRDRYAFTVADYHQLIASGHFNRTDRIELINGELTLMPPIGPEHSFHTTRITNTVPLKLPGGVLLRMNEPISMRNHSEPQPDAAIVRARADGYRTSHPEPKDVLLIIEVADNSVDFDLKVKARLYSKAGIAEYWVVDVKEHRVSVHTVPTARGYKTMQVFEDGDVIKSTSVKGFTIKVKELMS
ncbi:MAG: Uma2 family endonuclease [Verrucomicrobiaceae bacterium]|nr:Uma2 family endonuclease [Verrucomicrobiaceae bacterium]